VKLLFDQNLSPRLIDLLADIFSGSLHVRSIGLDRAADETVWRFALDHGFLIVSKDSDFQERSQIAASGPKIVWIRRGNCTTTAIEAMLRKNLDRIEALAREKDSGFLILL
jgi:predicted nuclease of predicted toxin-antitoxin system